MRAEVCAIAPHEWTIRKIEDVCSRVTSGGTPSRSNAEYFQGGVWPWVKTQELKDQWIDDTEEHITEEAVRSSSAKVLPPNTVLLALYGATVGQLGLLRREMTCNQACCALLVNEADANFRFLYYQLLLHRSQLKRLATGAAQQNLSGTLVRSLELPFPEPAEQRAIAGVLGSLDDKIEQNQRTAWGLERLARAIFRAWFVDFEPVKAKAAGATVFPGMPRPVFDALPTRFVDSAIGPVPEGWEVKAIAQIATFLNGLALQKYPPRGDGRDLRVIKIAQLRRGSTEGADWANGDVPNQYIVDDGDLLFSWSGTLEAELWFGGKGALNQHLFKVTSSHFPRWYCLLWIRQHLPWFRAIAASKATTMGHIQRGHLQEARIITPPAPVMRAADEVLGTLYDLQAQVQVESRKLAQMRDLLLPNLLSGTVRIDPTRAANGD